MIVIPLKGLTGLQIAVFSKTFLMYFRVHCVRFLKKPAIFDGCQPLN